MRIAIAAISAAVLALGSNAALAKKKAASTAAPTVWYFNLGGLSDQADIDAVLKETRRGSKLLSAELDLCYLDRDGWTAVDRFALALDIKGDRLSGAGRSSEAGKPVKVDLRRSRERDGTTFEGSIGYGDVTRKFVTVGNLDISAREFEADRPESLYEQPADFSQAAPDAIAIRVKRASLGGLLAALRQEKAKVEVFSLKPTCRALRSGALTVELQADPERAADLIARLRKVEGVIGAGWSSRGFPIERSVRIAAAAWRDAAGRLDRDGLGRTIADIVGKALSASSCRPSWDEVTGELTVTAQRPDRSIPGAGLTETISAYFTVSSEKPGGSEQLVVRLGYVTSHLADSGTGPRLNLIGDVSNEDIAEPAGADTILTEMAKALQGAVWNADAAHPGWAK